MTDFSDPNDRKVIAINWLDIDSARQLRTTHSSSNKKRVQLSKVLMERSFDLLNRKGFQLSNDDFQSARSD